MSRKQHLTHWLLILGMLLTSVLTVEYGGANLRTNLVLTPEPAAFDGTTYPIQYMPDWTSITDQSLDYSEYADSLISIPSYDTAILIASTDGLTWGASDYKEIVNTQITYPVVYAGNYELDGIEYAGSHPAVDIKAPEGTPVYAIANGFIEKVSYSSSGFGNHIVVAHYDVPTLTNANSSTDIYSSYSHLSEILVAEGDVVEKGQMIGKVGATGTATTNHLHFQIDNADAPWHPYWPFTYSEYSALEYSFFGAVNAGLGLDNVKAYTINPMKYVEQYLGEVTTYVYSSGDVATEVEEVAKEEPVSTMDFATIEIDNDPYVLLNNNLSVYLYLYDENGEKAKDPQFDGSIELSLSDTSIGTLSITHLEADDFNNNHASFIFSPSAEGTTTFTASFDDYQVTAQISVIAQANMVNSFEVETDGHFVVNAPETVTIKAIDINGNFTPTYSVNGNVNFSLTEGEGTFEPETLDKGDFKFGMATITFIPTSSDDVIIKAKNGAIIGFSSVIKSTLFSDVGTSYKFYKAVKYLRDENVVSGYDDGTFKPESSVSRVEALKMIFEAFDIELSDGSNLTYPDVDNIAWYADYVATAKVLGIADGYTDGTFKPADPVNRVEFLKMLFKAVEFNADPVVIGDPYDDVSNLDWFAAYVNSAKELNVTPVEGSEFEPDTDMNRGEVAETIYRWLAVSYNEADEYSVLLSIE